MPARNFAYSTVAIAPSPATSGTSLVVASGEGARFPAVPFKAVIWPATGVPTPANAEVVTVTARSTDTLTITRAQESSSARTVVVGDRIAATITAGVWDDHMPWVDVRAFGATGDGTTDDTTAFAAAVTAANGAPILVPGGTYIVENLALTVTGTRLYGLGNATIKKKTTGGASIIMLKIQAADVTIEGLTLDVDNYTNGQAVLIESGGQRATIRNNRILNPVLGVYLNNAAINDVRIEGNLFNGAGYGVLTHDNYTGSRLAIRNNTFIGGATGDAIEINTPGNPVSRPSAGAQEVEIVGNVVSGYTNTGANQGIGIGLAHVQGALVAGNLVRGCENDGIHVEDGSTNVTIVGNHVENCDRGGIVVLAVASPKEDCSMVTVVGNTVENCAIGVDGTGGISIETGASASGSSGVVVENNVIDGCGDAARATAYGIYLHAGLTDGRIAGNIVRNTAGTANAGIRLAASSNVTVFGNRCFDDQGTKTQLYGLQVAGAQTDVRIFANDLAGNLTGEYDESGIGTKTRYHGLWDPGHVPGYLKGQLGVNRDSSLNGQLHVVAKDSSTPVLALQQNSGGASAYINFYNTAGSLVGFIDTGANIGGVAFYNATNFNNAEVRVNTTGVLAHRNIADATPAFEAKQDHASSTGDIARFSNSGGVVAKFTQAGGLQAPSIKMGADSSTADDRFVRASDANGNLVIEAIPFSRTATVLNPATGQTIMTWRAPFACTVTAVRGHFKGGTSVVYNARKNQASNLLSTNRTMSTADAWDDGTAGGASLQNTAFAAGDDLEILIVTVNGAVTEASIQIDLTRP